MSDEAKTEVTQASEQTEKGDSDPAAPATNTGNDEKVAGGEVEKPPEEKGADAEGGAEGGEEEPKVKEKPQLSDPEEPDDDVPIVLVTGASGYIATHLIKQLLEQARFRVRGTVRSLENEKKVQPLRELVAEPKYPLRLIEADLSDPKSWIGAVRRCRYVFHVASPFPLKIPKNPDVLIKPAVEGSANVLKACADSGTVKRVVLTSSIAAISSGLRGNPDTPLDHVYTEKDWSAEETCPPYERSKLKAEQAAWELVKQLEEGKQFELVTICPGTVMGPVLTASSGSGTSASICSDILNGKTRGYADISISFIDVREVAAAHIAAIEKPEAAGNRYLLVHDKGVLFKKIGEILATEFKPQGYKIPTRDLSKNMVKILKLFNPLAKQTYPAIGKHLTWSNEKMKRELGIEPRDVQETMIDMGYSLIELGLVPKKRGYLGHPSTRPPPEKKEEEVETVPTTVGEATGEAETNPEDASKEVAGESIQKNVETSQEPTNEPAQDSSSSKPSEASKDVEPTSEPAKEAESAGEPPSEPSKEKEPASEHPKQEEPRSEPPEESPSEPPKGEEPSNEPTKEDKLPSEPAEEGEPHSEPAQDEEPPSKPAQDEEPPSKPAQDEEPPSEPAQDEEPPNEPAQDEPPSEPEKEEHPSTEEPPKEFEPPQEHAEQPSEPTQEESQQQDASTQDAEQDS